ncbi:MAG: ABC transporter permease subunit [Planctomycetaceae bacterium]
MFTWCVGGYVAWTGCLGAGFLGAGHGTGGTVAAAEPLAWGADREGGGPYLYPDPANPARTIGFEVDLAEALARELGRPGQRHVQCDWSQILEVLARGDIEVALNGYEFTRPRAARWCPSCPYYLYQLRLCTRRSDTRLHDWDGLRSPVADARLRVGVLEESAADVLVTREFGTTCEVVRYSGSIDAFEALRQGKLDATVQDNPVVTHYLEQEGLYPDLDARGEPRSEGFYVIYLRPDDQALCQQLNAALEHLRASGALQTLYERYGLWNDNQARLPQVWSGWDSAPRRGDLPSWRDLRRWIPKLLHAALVTIQLACCAMPLAMVMGLAVALGRSWSTPLLGGDGGGWGAWLLRTVLGAYVELVRGTPLAFQLFVIYFVLPRLGVTISEFWSGVAALAINYSAYECEIFRLGLQSVPRGQMEAALSLGMSRPLAVRRIILPQAIRTVIPATANDFIALFKDTSVCSVIAVEELSKQYSIVGKSSGLFLEAAAMAAVLYLAMSYPLSLASAWLERTLKRSA